MSRLLSRILLGRSSLALDLVPALLYTALLLYAGLSPLKSLPDPGFVPADKFWHLVAFGGLGALLFRALHHWDPESHRANRRAALSSIGLGALLEIMQGVLTRYRSAELADLVADALGALVAFFVISRMISGRSGAVERASVP